MDSFSYLLVWILTVLCVMRMSNSSAPNKRIFNGTAVSITDYPYAVPVLIKANILAKYGGVYVKEFYCGGSIISNRWVITAAHCFDQCSLYGECHVALRTGTNFFFREGIPHVCDLVLIHNQYINDFRGSLNDISLLRGTRSFLLGSIAKSIPIAEKPPTKGTFIIALGWANATKCNDSHTEYLRNIEHEILDSVRCRRFVGFASNQIDERMLCAGVPPLRQRTTTGDSGGPVVLNGTLVGIITMGAFCTNRRYPDLFVNVSHYYNWIRKNTLSNSTQQVDTISNSTQQVDTISNSTQQVDKPGNSTQQVDKPSNSTQQVDKPSNSTQQVVPVEKLPHCFEFNTNNFAY